MAALWVCIFMQAEPMQAQVRGVYPAGMSATNSGVTPESGFSYSNLLAIYSRNKFVGPDGEVLVTGAQSVVMDLNSFVWVSRRRILGARFSMSATLPVANNSLTSDVTLTINRSFWVGIQSVPIFARYMASLHPRASLKKEQTTMLAQGTGLMRCLLVKRST
jgi:hypothetical protein